MQARIGSHVRRHAVGYLALFVALGGTSYAAVNLPKNSVGTKQLKTGAVTTKKLARSAVSSSKIAPNSVSSSKLADNSVGGAKVADGSLTASDINTATLPFPNPPRGGTTLRGTFAVAGVASSAGDVFQEGVSFGFSLASAPTVHLILPGTTAPAGCTGGTAQSPTADPGHLCIYEETATIATASTAEFDPSNPGTGGIGTAAPYGFAIQLTSAAGGNVGARGTWAVTAPVP
jgi:hypothetical protein